MNDQNRDTMPFINFNGVRMHTLSMAETVAKIMGNIENGIYTQHVVVNVAKIVNMEKDPGLRKSVTSCDIINIDGKGVVIGARICGYKVPERVAGIDLFYELIKEAAIRKMPVFFLGARQEIVQKTVKRMRLEFPELKIAGFNHGYFWDDEEKVVEKIKASKATLLFVAITSPKKENFINKWKNELGVQFVMGVGGTFDVISGKVKRAPLFMQKLGMEWLYRVYQEPRRMWKRYLITNSRFLLILIKELHRNFGKRTEVVS